MGFSFSQIVIKTKYNDPMIKAFMPLIQSRTNGNNILLTLFWLELFGSHICLDCNEWVQNCFYTVNSLPEVCWRQNFSC